MKVTLKLFASLRELLPPDASWAGIELDVTADVTPNQIIDRFHVPRPMAHLVLQNGMYLAPQERDRPVLKQGDVLAVWPPIAGG